MPLQPPSWELPFGSDKQGRNLYAVMVEGTPLTLRIGLFAGVLGVAIGATLAFVSGYYGGVIDNIIRVIVDVGLTIPGLLILITLGMRVREGLTVNQMALIVGALAWLYPARTIRSQVLTLKQRGYVQIARLSGMSGPEVIFKELMPNSAAVSRRVTGWCGLGCGTGRNRTRSARSRPLRSPNARHDDLLDQLQRGDH